MSILEDEDLEIIKNLEFELKIDDTEEVLRRGKHRFKTKSRHKERKSQPKPQPKPKPKTKNDFVKLNYHPPIQQQQNDSPRLNLSNNNNRNNNNNNNNNNEIKRIYKPIDKKPIFIVIKLPFNEEYNAKFANSFTLKKVANYVKKKGRMEGHDKGKYSYLYEKKKYNFFFEKPHAFHTYQTIKYDVESCEKTLSELFNDNINKQNILIVSPKEEFVEQPEDNREFKKRYDIGLSTKFTYAL